MKKRRLFLLTLVTILALLLAACGGDTAVEPTEAPADTGSEEQVEEPTEELMEEPTEEAAEEPMEEPAEEPAEEPVEEPAETLEANIEFLSVQQEDQGFTQVIGVLAEECQGELPNVTYEYVFVPQADLNQRVQLLAGSDSLPLLFNYESGAPLLDLVESGQVLDIEETFTELGIYEELNQGAVNLLKGQIDGAGLYALPLEFNVEGFWYNQQIFEENNLEVPTTWDEMLQAAGTLQESDVQPFAVAGAESWPITRLINGYVMRYYGADVMTRVTNGELEVTDEGFIEAAQVIQEMGQNGYFGQGVTTIDYATAVDQFLQGQAAMFYMGSWVIGDFNNEERNEIGVENIGFFNIPLVEGGEGTLNDYSVNAGLTTSISSSRYEENPEAIGAWLTCVFEDYGDRAMQEQGLITGFRVEEMPEDVPVLTQLAQEQIDMVENGALWFEGRFNAQTQDVAWNNAELLVIGEMTPEEYMSALQTAVDEQIAQQ